jgi:tetraacyldisaccharide 4'-kinase
MDEAALHDLLSGRRTDFGARLLRQGLQVASWGYSAAMTLRNLAYQRQWLAASHASVPIISLGNITTGGTGKTPFAAWLANQLILDGHRPGLLSRGYHALKSTGADEAVVKDEQYIGNDEKRVLDRLCPGVPHLQQRDRVRSARQIVAEFDCDVLLLDDGFQHRRLHRNLDLVLIDALQPWGYGHLLPRGLLREPKAGLCRADLILITRADQCTEAQRDHLRTELRQIRDTDECVEVAFKPSRLVDLEWQPLTLSSLIGKSAFAFCGIGNPGGFRQTVESLGVASFQLNAYPDHHHYSSDDLARLAKTAKELSADVVLTTQKDLVKIPSAAWDGPPLFAIEIGVTFLSGRNQLDFALQHLFES